MEHVHKINNAGNLVGIVNEPESPRQGKPCFIFINGGFLHRVGPYRLYTETARKLEMLGFYVLRFDLAGLGDSAVTNTSKNFAEQVQTDVTVAMEFMQQRFQCSEFITSGLCSGGDDALEAALRNKSASGVLLLDGSGYRTRRFYQNRLLRHYNSRLVDPKRWKRMTGRLIERFKVAKNETEPQPAFDEDLRTLKSDEELQTAVETLAGRGIKMHFIFSGGVFEYYNYAGQLFDMFESIDLQGNVSESFFKDSDHMFLLHRDRQAIIDDIVQWADNTFAAESQHENMATAAALAA